MEKDRAKIGIPRKQTGRYKFPKECRISQLGSCSQKKTGGEKEKVLEKGARPFPGSRNREIDVPMAFA